VGAKGVRGERVSANNRPGNNSMEGAKGLGRVTLKEGPEQGPDNRQGVWVKTEETNRNAAKVSGEITSKSGGGKIFQSIRKRGRDPRRGEESAHRVGGWGGNLAKR